VALPELRDKNSRRGLIYNAIMTKLKTNINWLDKLLPEGILVPGKLARSTGECRREKLYN